MRLQAGDWLRGTSTNAVEQIGIQVTAGGFALVALSCLFGNGGSIAERAEHYARCIGAVVRRSSEMGIDAGRLYLAGFGPGATLSARLATQPALLETAEIQPGTLQGVIAISGCYDFSSARMHPRLEEWLDIGTAEVSEELQLGSPFLQAASGIVGPPILLAFSEYEPFLLDEQAKRLYGLLLRRKWPARLAVIPGARHTDLVSGIGARRVANALGGEDLGTSHPDMLGPAIVTFLKDVDGGVFEAMFHAAWPQNWPTGGFSPDYTMSEALPLPDVEWFRDLAYVPDGHTLQRLDVQVPRAFSGVSRSVFFYVHGGGWRAGSRAMVHGLAELAAAQDMVFVSVDYRLAPAFKMPDLAADVASALRWVSQNIGRYGGDPQKLVLVGVSAGAHLVALLATDPDFGATLAASPVKGVIAISGIYDLGEFAEPGILPSRVEQAMSETGAQALHRYSPGLLASTERPVPPFLVTFTDADLAYLDRQAVDFFDRLSAAGADCRLHAVPDRDHFNQTVGIGRWVGLYDDTLGPTIVEFLYRLGLLPVSSTTLPC